MSILQQKITQKFLKTLEKIEFGSLCVVLPDGTTYSFNGKQAGTHATFSLLDWRVITAVSAKGDIGLAETYRDGLWDSDDITALLMFGLENEGALEKYIYGNRISQFIARFLYFFTRNTINGSRRNVHAHYDISNEFYALWLDKSMSYSSALFKTKHDSLELAQNYKYDRMLERLDSFTGDLLEIGCGWGGFAKRAVSKHNFNIKAITISEKQFSYAKSLVTQNTTFALEDYRIQQGSYDHIVSIEMFEAVGEQFWPTYFEKMRALLKYKGKAIIQTITIDEPYFDRYRKSGDMIRSMIFPGGMLPTAQRFKSEAELAGLRLNDSFAFGQDYASTLRHWLNSFESKLSDIKALGFDLAFIRVWRFYLAICIAGFTTGRTNVLQMELQHV